MWCGDSSLKEAFPGLYSMASMKDMPTIAADMDYSSDSLRWNISSIHLAHNWEVVVLASFYSFLYSLRTRREREEDKLWWAPSYKGKFDIRSIYILACKEASPFPWKSIWRTKTPSKVAFFAWSTVLGKILSMENLKKRHLIMVTNCCLCKLNRESVVDHLLLHYEVVSALWNAIFSHFGLS